MSPPLVVTPFYQSYFWDTRFLGCWVDPFFTELNLCCQYFVLLRDSIYIGKIKFSRWSCFSCYLVFGHIFQTIQALSCVFEVESFLQEILILQSAQCISDGTGREITLFGDFFLCKKTTVFKYLVDKFCRRWQPFNCLSQVFVLWLFDAFLYLYVFLVIVNKSDPSFSLLLCIG